MIAAGVFVRAISALAFAASAVSPRAGFGTTPFFDFSASVRAESETRRATVLEVRFPSPFHNYFAPDNLVWGHLILPRGARRLPPCVLVLPVMAAPNVWIETRFMNALVRDGYAVFWIEMPYQFHRRPSTLEPSGQVFLARTPKRLADNFRQSVMDAGRAVDWLERSGKVDPARIGILGISLGAIVGSTALSRDNRLRGGIFLLGGADFPSLVLDSAMTRDSVWKSRLRDRDLREAWKGLDPLDYEKSNHGKKVLLINVRSDEIIPRVNALKLKEAFPDARQMWLPLGHYTAILHLLWLPTYVVWKFRALLGAP